MKGDKKIYLVLGLSLLFLFTIWALFPGVFAPYDIKHSFKPFLKPSSVHFLGTNDLGYDIFSELVHATFTTLTIGLTAAFVTIVIGGVIGLLAGYLQGVSGDILDGVINIFLLIPMLPMVIAVSAFFGSNNRNIVIIIAMLGWCSTAKAVRARVRQLKQMEFVEALITLGMDKKHIIFFHILPNTWHIISAQYILTVANCMLTEASVSFMGLGDVTRVTWGGMISTAFKRGGFVKGQINWYLSPGVCITLCVLAFLWINLYVREKNQLTGESYLE